MTVLLATCRSGLSSRLLQRQIEVLTDLSQLSAHLLRCLFPRACQQRFQRRQPLGAVQVLNRPRQRRLLRDPVLEAPFPDREFPIQFPQRDIPEFVSAQTGKGARLDVELAPAPRFRG